jgi:hypothetical protein
MSQPELEEQHAGYKESHRGAFVRVMVPRMAALDRSNVGLADNLCNTHK